MNVFNDLSLIGIGRFRLCQRYYQRFIWTPVADRMRGLPQVLRVMMTVDAIKHFKAGFSEGWLTEAFE
jgi:hypothetical protein